MSLRSQFPNLARGLILHVDDDEAMRRSTAMLMRSAGFETREAACGEDAVTQVDSLRGRLDVLIVDYNLGQSMTGTEVAEEFARLLGHAVPTVILTGDPANAEVPWLADAPVWLARKPLHPGYLVSRAAAARGFPARRRGYAPALTATFQFLLAYSGNTRGRFFSISLIRSFGAGCVLRNFGGDDVSAAAILFHSVSAARGS